MPNRHVFFIPTVVELPERRAVLCAVISLSCKIIVLSVCLCYPVIPTVYCATEQLYQGFMSPFTQLDHLSVLLLLAALQAEAATHFIGCLSSNAASSISCLLCTWAHSSRVQIEKLLTLAHPSEFVPVTL